MIKKVYAIEKEFFCVVELIVICSSDDFFNVSFYPCLNVVAFKVCRHDLRLVDDVALNWFYKDVFLDKVHALKSSVSLGWE